MEVSRTIGVEMIMQILKKTQILALLTIYYIYNLDTLNLLEYVIRNSILC